MGGVKLENVRKVYPNGRAAVAGASFEVQPGELIVFVGPSGCGKTTLLRMIAGLEEISSGTLSIAGRVVNDLPPKDRDIAMVFQNYALYPHMSVAENMGFGLRLRGLARTAIETKVHDAATMLGLDHVLKMKPGQLSGGQQQRVGIARAIVGKPDVILADEPTGNLELLEELNRDGTTIVVITHDRELAARLPRRVEVRDGRIVSDTRRVEGGAPHRAPAAGEAARYLASVQQSIEGIPGSAGVETTCTADDLLCHVPGSRRRSPRNTLSPVLSASVESASPRDVWDRPTPRSLSTLPLPHP